jgi:LPS sulfotransferase NodH
VNPALSQALVRHGITRSAIMATTFRSGSTWIGRILDRHGLPGMKAERLRVAETTRDIAAALNTMAAAQPGPIFASRVMWGQFSRLARALDHGPADARALAAQFPQAQWLFLRRRDVLRQGISYWRALATDRWHVTLATTDPEPAVPYDFAAIDACLRKLAWHCRMWERFFEAAGIAPTVLWYEDAVADFGLLDGYMAGFGLKLGGTRSQMRVQRDAHTDHCLERYLADRRALA